MNTGVKESVSVKYQTEQITIPSGTIAGIQSIRRTLDNSMDRVVGVRVFVLSNAGAGINWRIGLKDDDTVFQHPTHWEDWVSSNAVPYKDAYKEFDIPARSNQVEVQLQFLANTTQALLIDVVFKLERRKKTADPKPQRTK